VPEGVKARQVYGDAENLSPQWPKASRPVGEHEPHRLIDALVFSVQFDMIRA
jgi:hypothetical protein